MKQIKKLLALVLALAICAAFALPAMANEDDGSTGSPEATTEGKYTLTMNNAQEGHTYVIYQLLTGTVLPGGTNIPTGTLGDVEWGNSGFEAKDENGESISASEYAEKLSKLTSAELDTEIESIKSSFSKSFVPTPDADGNGTITWTNLPGGYYVVVDETAEGDISDLNPRSHVMVQVVGNTTITPKAENLVPDKGVKELSDAEAKYEEIVNSEVGKKLEYQVTATVSVGTMNLNDNYWVALTDTMSKGHTYLPDTAKIVIVNDNGTEIEVGADLPVVEHRVDVTEKTTTLTVEKFDLKALLGKNIPSIGNVIVKLTYQAVVNADAVELDKVTNSAKWDYGHNGDDLQEGTSVETTVYVYDLSGEKINGDGESLSGAEFTLTREDGALVDIYKLADGEYYAWNNDEETLPEGAAPVEGNVIVANGGKNGNMFVVKGLAAGKYILTETKTPDGYNTMDALEIEIVPNKDDNGELTGGCTYKYGEATNSGLVQVVNNKGTTLPSTGGMGTTILYIVGGVLVVGAGVLLFTKKRMHG